MVRLTLASVSSMLDAVLIRSRHVATLLMALVLTTGDIALCAGWMATPEARMACCSEGGACAMHTPGAHHASSAAAVSQAEADRCCAASEPDDAAPTTSIFVSTASLAVDQSALPFVLPAAAPRFVSWRGTAPPIASRLPRHLLLSVFLV